MSFDELHNLYMNQTPKNNMKSFFVNFRQAYEGLFSVVLTIVFFTPGILLFAWLFGYFLRTVWEVFKWGFGI